MARSIQAAHLRQHGAVCSRCRRVSGNLECHHKVPIEQDRGLELDIDNIEIICRDCHISHHRKPIPPDRAKWDALLLVTV